MRLAAVASRREPKSTLTDREALADARARVEMLERERGDLIRRAEAAEMTAQQATAAALEIGRAHV